MRILMVSHYFDSHLGGIEIIAARLFHGLTAAGYEIVWAAADVTPPPAATHSSRTYSMAVWNGMESAAGLPIPLVTPRSLWRLRQQVAHADVVLLHDCLYLSNLAAFVFARVRGVPVICVQHIGFVPYKNPFLRALMRFANLVVTRPMLSRAQQVVFYSELTRGYFDRISYRRPPLLVFNGVDTDIFHPAWDRDTRTASRKRLALPERATVVLFVGRFVEKKGLGVLRHMAAAAPDITWAFAGSGLMDPRKWGLPNVRVFSGLCRTSLADLYRVSDALVLPSTGEGFPLVIQEGLASGLPIICGTDTVTADEALKDFVQGVPVNSHDDEQTARAFLAAVYDQLRDLNPEKAALRRHEFAISRYSWKHTVDRYLEIASALGRT